MFDHVLNKSFHIVLSGDYKPSDLTDAVDNAILAYQIDYRNTDLPFSVVGKRMRHVNDAYDFLSMGDDIQCIESLKLFWSV